MPQRPWFRPFVALLVGGATLTCAGLGWTFVKRPLPVPSASMKALPGPPEVTPRLLRVPTARVQTQHGFSVRGAPVTAPLVSAMSAFLVEHPEGRVLIDAGMGRRGVEHVATVPLLMQAIITLELQAGVSEQLAALGVDDADLDGVILTHTHWDHVSGLQDLPPLPVWLTEEELAYSRVDEDALLYRQIDAERPIDVRIVRFDDGPYGPFTESEDFFGDGSVVLVKLPGHTPGSVGVFVHQDDVRYLFIGDTAWAHEGVDWPAEKPWLSRRMVDLDAAGVREQLVLLHRLQAANPDLVVVPAHDERVHQRIPSQR